MKPDIYDPAINPLYRDVLCHYGATALPCRVRDPDRKGKVERAVGQAQSTPLQGQKFDEIEAGQAYLDHWEDRWADTRIHRTTKRQVSAMFAEEKPHLKPLPLEPFRYYEYGNRVVHLDGLIEVRGLYYSTPPGNIGRTVWVQWDQRQVRILEPGTGKLLREHLRQNGVRYNVHREDRPRHTPMSTVQLLGRAANAGVHIGALCQRIHLHDGETGIRRILGVLALAKSFGVAVVDDACATAIDLNTP